MEHFGITYNTWEDQIYNACLIVDYTPHPLL